MKNDGRFKSFHGRFVKIRSFFQKTGVDITIFNQDIRVITTVQTREGVRATGTKSNSMVAEDVLKGGHPHFYSSTMVEGIRYFSYYEPIYALNGKCIGMIFVGKPSEEGIRRQMGRRGDIADI